MCFSFSYLNIWICSVFKLLLFPLGYFYHKVCTLKSKIVWNKHNQFFWIVDLFIIKSFNQLLINKKVFFTKCFPRFSKNLLNIHINTFKSALININQLYHILKIFVLKNDNLFILFVFVLKINWLLFIV